MKHNNLVILIAIVGLALSSLACGAGETTPTPTPIVETESPTATATPIVETGQETVDNAVTTMVENQKENVCNLNILGIAGLTDPQARVKALENCTPKAEDAEKYDEMLAEARAEITAAASQ